MTNPSTTHIHDSTTTDAHVAPAAGDTTMGAMENLGEPSGSYSRRASSEHSGSPIENPSETASEISNDAVVAPTAEDNGWEQNGYDVGEVGGNPDNSTLEPHGSVNGREEEDAGGCYSGSGEDEGSGGCCGGSGEDEGNGGCCGSSEEEDGSYDCF